MGSILRATLLAAAFALSAAACGGSDGCAGFITINVPPAECEMRAKELGCPSFHVDGNSCGLTGCATCDGL